MSVIPGLRLTWSLSYFGSSSIEPRNWALKPLSSSDLPCAQEWCCAVSETLLDSNPLSRQPHFVLVCLSGLNPSREEGVPRTTTNAPQWEGTEWQGCNHCLWLLFFGMGVEQLLLPFVWDGCQCSSRSFMAVAWCESLLNPCTPTCHPTPSP